MALTRSIHLKTEIPGPKSKAILERKERVIADPLSIYIPVVIAEGRGATITDVDGNTFLDFTGGVGCLNVGHSHPRVVEAAQAQLERFSHTDFTIVPYEVYVDLAERLTELAPVRKPGEGRVLQRRNRGGRELGQVRARAHGPPGGDRVRGRVPRPHAALAVAHVEDASVQGRPRAVRAGDLPRAVPAGVPRAFDRRGAQRARARVHRAGRPGARRGDRRRAGAGRGRLPSCAAGVPRGAAADLRRARDRPRRRRGADRLRPHRADVRDGALRRRAGPHGRREVDRRRACRSRA